MLSLLLVHLLIRSLLPLHLVPLRSLIVPVLALAAILLLPDLIIKSGVLSLLFEIRIVEGHDLILELPQSVFELILLFLGGFYLAHYLFLMLRFYKNTYSISRISYWCRRVSYAILAYSYSH